MRLPLVHRRFGILALGALGAAVACTPDFDTTRSAPARGTVGEELFGLVCDRVGAQALHEDLTGGSFNAICHKDASGNFAGNVDQTRLPSITGDALDVNGKTVSLAVQQETRQHAVARIEALARRRADLISALDATFPDIMVAVKDDSCNPSKTTPQDKLSHQLADMLGRFTPLYDDGTIPQSTESLASVMNAFNGSPDALASYARLDARQGYRPLAVALGSVRPMMAYPGLRDFVTTTLSLLARDSKPYDTDAQGHHPVTAGAAYPQLTQLLTVLHEEFRNATGDGAVPPLGIRGTDAVGRGVLSRPRTNLEFVQDFFYAQDPAFGGGDSRYIVKRDPRGYASVALVHGALPSPFLDKNGDGLADVDDLGRFVTSNGQSTPTPFFAVGAPDAPTRDPFGRALTAQVGQLLYDYIDTSHVFAASLLHDTKALVNPDPSAKHETMMDSMAGAIVLSGVRDGSLSSTRTYTPDPLLIDRWKLTHTDPPPANLGTTPVTVKYDAFHAESAPLLDLVYALGQALGDQTSDDTLAYTNTLFAKDLPNVARLAGDGLQMKALANKHTEAQIPVQSTFWDEMIDVAIQLEKEPGLLEDVLRSFGADDALPLGQIFSNYDNFKDEISYDKNNLNGPAWNVTTSSNAPMQTPIDRTKPDTGFNRSAFQRFVQLIHDTNGVTFCNKDQAVVHAQLATPLGTLSVDMPILGGGYGECQVFKIDNGARFFLDSIIGRAQLYLRNDTLRTGIAAGIGAATVGVMQDSSGILGFWDDPSSQTLRPKPQFLARQMFFDVHNDSPNPGDTNYLTNHFLGDLVGADGGTIVCQERVIDDPCAPGNGNGCSPQPPDAKGNPSPGSVSPDGKVHGLRMCRAGQYLLDRDNHTIFTWEDFGFYKAMTPLLTAFANHNREDIFLALMETMHRHWADANGSATDCQLTSDPNMNCTKDGLVTYEPLLVEQFTTDFLAAMHDVTKTLTTVTIPHCDTFDAATGGCSATHPVDGISVMAEAVRALVDPDRAAAVGLKDRAGRVIGLRNDRTPNPQVTPMYLITGALDAMDKAFADYATAHPNDKNRMAAWRSARSQLVDQFLAVNGTGLGSTFANASFPKITPVIVGALREQLLAHCPSAFTPPYTPCTWARGDLVQHMQDTMGGPTYAALMDLVDAIRADDAGRTQLEALLSYLLDTASQNDALQAMLGTSNDIIQALRDDTNLVPLYHVIAQAVQPSLLDAGGQMVQAGMLDAQMGLLGRIFGRAFAGTNETCSSELDPNQVMSIALQHLVTPVQTADGKPGATPLEVMMDVFADVNRAAPDQTDKLAATDYDSISANLSDFLSNKERGLEQFYEIVRQGTAHE